MCFYMVNYSNVKIYKIVCYETGKEYIGSTCGTIIIKTSVRT